MNFQIFMYKSENLVQSQLNFAQTHLFVWYIFCSRLLHSSDYNISYMWECYSHNGADWAGTCFGVYWVIKGPKLHRCKPLACVLVRLSTRMPESFNIQNSTIRISAAVIFLTLHQSIQVLCAVLFSFILFITIPYMHCNLPQSNTLYSNRSYCIMLYCNHPHCITLYCTLPHSTMLLCTLPHWFFFLMCYTSLVYIILYYTSLYCNILYSTPLQNIYSH